MHQALAATVASSRQNLMFSISHSSHRFQILLMLQVQNSKAY